MAPRRIARTLLTASLGFVFFAVTFGGLEGAAEGLSLASLAAALAAIAGIVGVLYLTLRPKPDPRPTAEPKTGRAPAPPTRRHSASPN